MVFFSLFMTWAFNWNEYQVQPGERHTSIWRPLLDSINLCTPSSPYPLHPHSNALGLTGDFALEIGSEFRYFASRLTGRRPPPESKRSLGQVFGVEGYAPVGRDGAYALPVTRMSYDDDIRLVPYSGSLPHASSPEPIDAKWPASPTSPTLV